MKLSSTRIQLLVLLALLVLPFLISSDFYMDVLILILIWAAAAGAWNIAGGFGGLFSLGHAAYFGVGAYTSTLLFINFGLSPWLGMLVGAILSALLGLIIGVLTLRLRGPFFVMASIGFLEVLRILAINWASLTKGSGGLSVPFEPSLLNMSFYSKGPFFYIALFVALLPYLFALYMKRSKLGYQMVAVREDEAAAEAAGVNAVRVKLTVTVVSTFLIALAGTVYAQYIGFIDPLEVFSLHLSIELALMAIVGGMALASGPVVGAALITLLSVVMSGLLGGQGAGLYLVVNGLLLLLVILFIPQGIVPWLSKKFGGQASSGSTKVGEGARA